QVGPLGDGETLEIGLKDADAVVFVVDSDPAGLEASVEMLANVRHAMARLASEGADTPLVFQLVNRQHPCAVALEELERRLDTGDALLFLAEPDSGPGVFDTLKAATKQCLLRVTPPPPNG
ncbi:MAG TPA: hypothetical protein VK447_03285, partial [Myxococcaceae bacterium]|nr:hypothetical protein [Myxococcaceae bacterium]